MFNYMLSFETAGFLASLIACFVGIYRCGALCNFGYSYFTKLFELIFHYYLGNVLNNFQISLEISFAFERIRILSNKKTKSKLRFRYQVIVTMFVALVVTLPNYLVTRSIVPFGIVTGTDQILYQISVSSFAQNEYWQIILLAIGSVRALLFIIIFVLNMIVIYKFKQFMLKKKKLLAKKNSASGPSISTGRQKIIKETTKEIKKENRITKVVVVTSLNYLIGNAPIGIALLIFQQLGSTSLLYSYFASVGILVVAFSHGSYIFLYFLYNPTYKKYLLEFFSR